KRIWFIRYIIHCIHVVYFSFCDMYINRYLSDYIKQRMHLDTLFGFSKARPFIKTQAEIDCCGVECIKSSIYNELPVNSLALRIAPVRSVAASVHT
ncbi:MAG: hypothetical protein PHS38_10690, partial [Bacteroidales bacterium]|nr:hypothetical protein [Bacteroidales bacterium]